MSVDDDKTENNKNNESNENNENRSSMSDPLLEELLEQARGKNAGQRHSALKALQQMGPAGIESLMQLLFAEARKRHNIKTVLTVIAWLLLPLSILMMPVMLFSLCLNGLLQTTLVAVGIWIVTWTVFVLRTRLPLTARQKDMMLLLTEMNDVRAIGPLTDALISQSLEDPLLLTTLTRLLLQVRSSDARLLSREDRANLCRELTKLGPTRNPEKIAFVIAILRALEQVGDAEALPYVGQLARHYPPPAPEIHEAAARCLEFLQMRGGANTIRQTYLRASDKTAGSPGNLLRPAQEPGETQPEALLRPASAAKEKATEDEDATSD